jgi:hypothetical protein
VLSAATLAALPAETRTVTFTAGTSPETLTETGPTLDAVLRAAHIRTGFTTWVAAVGSDGYVATVTPAEAWVAAVRCSSRWPRTAPRWPPPAWSPTATSRAAATSPACTTSWPARARRPADPADRRLA